jgi:uncharacterized protein DUF4388
MPEVLRGNLAQLPLTEVLKLLVSGGQSGRLDVRDGTTKGEIYLCEGRIVHAVAGPWMGEGALRALLGWPRGDFDFVPDMPSPEETVQAPSEQLLREAAQRMQDWKEIKKVVPSSEAIFRLSAGGGDGAVSLQPEEWRVLARVNGATSVAQIASLLNQDELEVAKVLFKLSKAGLLEAGEKPQGPTKATINGAFFSKLKDQFVDIMGPLGPTIIDEAVEGLGETRESFPRDKAAALVERLSAEIRAEDNRAQFQRSMLELLRKLP